MSTDDTHEASSASTSPNRDDEPSLQSIFKLAFGVCDEPDRRKDTPVLDARLRQAREMYSSSAYCGALIRNFGRIPMDFIMQGDEESLRVLRGAGLDLSSYGSCARGVSALLSGHSNDYYAEQAYACADAMAQLMRHLGRAWKAQEDRLRDEPAKPSHESSRPQRRSYRWPDYTSYNCYLHAQGSRRLLRTFTTLAFMPAIDFAYGVGRVGSYPARRRLIALLDRKRFTGHGVSSTEYSLLLEYLNLLDKDDATCRRLRYELVVEPFAKLPPEPRRRSR